MANTHFTGPVYSENGFVGAITLTAISGTTLAVSGTSTLTGAVSAPAGVTGPLTGNVTGNVTGFATLPTYTVTSANALATKPAGKIIYVSNGLAGAPCIAVGDGTDWISPAGTAIAAA